MFCWTGAMAKQLKCMVILTENHTLVPPGDLLGVVQMAVDAEAAGADAVMLSDHVCLGFEAGAEGPALWFGGQSMHPALLQRLVAHGSGFHPFGTPTEEDLRLLSEEMQAAGRSMADLELIGGTRARFSATDDCADLDETLADIPDQVAAGYTTFCVTPSQHIDDSSMVRSLVEQMVTTLKA